LLRLHARVHGGIHQRLPVAWAADVVGVAPAYFSTWLSRRAGIGYIAWLTLCRLNHAERLWTEENRSVLDVALAVGFGSVRSFERACRSHRNCSPTELRDRLQVKAVTQLGSKNPSHLP
jgi:AraC-like DNA-binding protein